MKEPLLAQAQDVIDRLSSLSRTYGGKGNYTDEREQLFKGESVDNIIAEIKTRRAKSETK